MSDLDKAFREECQRIRNEDVRLKDQSNLLRKFGRMIIRPTFIEAWGEPDIYLRIHDVPGTLSGRILRLQANVPPLNTSCEILGDKIDHVPFKSMPLLEEDHEDTTVDSREAASQLPIVNVDKSLHFTKETRSRNEVDNLLRAKGHPNVIELLGRTEDGRLVFPRYRDHAEVVFIGQGISEFRRLFLELADAIIFLHSKGIIHRDLAPRNILVASDRRVVLCDLEADYGSSYCPEVARARDQGLSDSEIPYSEKSDVFCFGTMIAELILANNVRTPWQFTGNFAPPVPFNRVFRSCISVEAADRPTMLQLKKMLEDIAVPATLQPDSILVPLFPRSRAEFDSKRNNF
ncbi:hypothetical protein D9757_007073 [Collybiopsis confluens]|uniref:Protein kinase domain-containing protein n=1 Tax=Collybiopsis confluens TaxID=2823264 RepID=A0A8H5M4R6_9AGAR|nr:hypothetical protein D9757_007073 [Collybiopsis confluens]